jgi:predicted nucleic acid-binding Zn ribbon protein
VTGGRDPDPESSPEPIGGLLDAVRRDLGVPQVAVDGSLDAAWRAVAGPAAAHSTVRSIRNGVLTVAAADPAWASRLRHQERPLLEALAARLGTAPAHRIRVVVEVGGGALS